MSRRTKGDVELTATHDKLGSITVRHAVEERAMGRRSSLVPRCSARPRCRRARPHRARRHGIAVTAWLYATASRGGNYATTGRRADPLHGSHLLAGAIIAGLAFGGCTGDEGDSPRESRSGVPRTEPSASRLVTGPPANLIEACKRVARQTDLTVYCPPVVPKGSVEAPVKRRGNAGVFADEGSYTLSLQSESLADRDAARKDNPDFPNVPNRPRGGDFAWNSFAATHWVVAAARPARLVRRSVDQRLQHPSQGVAYESEPRHFTAKGVRATVLTGDIAAGGMASSAHAIVYWQLAGTGYLASVHFDHQAPVAVKIARGLIEQMVDCPPRSRAPRSESCKWVFPTT
jgi:hypothetical protein